jgi:hypothetical protein
MTATERGPPEYSDWINARRYEPVSALFQGMNSPGEPHKIGRWARWIVDTASRHQDTMSPLEGLAESGVLQITLKRWIHHTERVH